MPADQLTAAWIAFNIAQGHPPAVLKVSPAFRANCEAPYVALLNGQLTGASVQINASGLRPNVAGGGADTPVEVDPMAVTAVVAA